MLWDFKALTSGGIAQVGDSHCWTQLGSGAENVT